MRHIAQLRRWRAAPRSRTWAFFWHVSDFPLQFNSRHETTGCEPSRVCAAITVLTFLSFRLVEHFLSPAVLWSGMEGRRGPCSRRRVGPAIFTGLPAGQRRETWLRICHDRLQLEGFFLVFTHASSACAVRADEGAAGEQEPCGHAVPWFP